MTVNRMIFSLNPGRCGSMFIYEAMRKVPDVWSFHEPFPAFHTAARLDRFDKKKWLQSKIDYILGIAQSTYFESSNQFRRGFPELFLELGWRPDILVIRRPIREVALSKWRLGYIPTRWHNSKVYSIRPDDKDAFYHCENFDDWSDYQICYWSVLEIYSKINYYQEMLSEAGSVIVETTTKRMTTVDGFLEILEGFGLPEPIPGFEKVFDKKWNATGESARDRYPPGDIEAEEKEIRSSFNIS